MLSFMMDCARSAGLSFEMHRTVRRWPLGTVGVDDREVSYTLAAQRSEKISNKSSFGIIDIADSSISDRIIVIVTTACFIHDGAYR